MTRLRSRTLLALPAAAVAALAACEVKGDGKGDTIAVPAAAIDTTNRTSQAGGAAVTAGTPGAGTAATGASAATGVDTPITRRLREGQAKRDSAAQQGAASGAKRP